MKNFFFLFALSLLFSSPAFSQSFPIPTSAPSSQPSSQPNSQPASSTWKLSQEKNYLLYKVQIFIKENSSSPLGIESGKLVISDKQGKTLYQTIGMLFSIDPLKMFSAPPPQPLDLDHDGAEDLLIQNFSGGAHCCYSYQLFSLGKTLKNLGSIRLLDCGEHLTLEDLNQDGALEILACNPSFTYLPKIPYAESPFPPMVFKIEQDRWVNQDAQHPKVFYSDIEERKKELAANSDNRSDLLQIVLDYLITGHEVEAWKTFDLLNLSNKDELRQELLKRIQQYKQTYILNSPSSQPSSKPTSQPSSKPARKTP